jgi:hypothetical protein
MNIFIPSYLCFEILKFSLKINFIKKKCTIHNCGLIHIYSIFYLILNKYENIICIKINQKYDSIILLIINNVLLDML